MRIYLKPKYEIYNDHHARARHKQQIHEVNLAMIYTRLVGSLANEREREP